MTVQAESLLAYLDRYLTEKPARRQALTKLFQRHTGRDLNRGHLWKHRERRSQPNLETALVYLVFLHKARELLPIDPKSKRPLPPGRLFAYRHPEWLKA